MIPVQHYGQRRESKKLRSVRSYEGATIQKEESGFHGSIADDRFLADGLPFRGD